MACTVLSSSLTLALCVGTRLVLRPSGETFSPWTWSCASSISCLQFSHGTSKHIPHSIPSTFTVQRRPTTARLGQRTLARLAEPLPSSQIPVLARERAALTLVDHRLDPWAPPKSLSNTFFTLRTYHETYLHACCLIPCPFASCSYFSPSSARVACMTDTHAAHPARITLPWSTPTYFRAVHPHTLEVVIVPDDIRHRRTPEVCPLGDLHCGGTFPKLLSKWSHAPRTSPPSFFLACLCTSPPGVHLESASTLAPLSGLKLAPFGLNPRSNRAFAASGNLYFPLDINFFSTHRPYRSVKAPRTPLGRTFGKYVSYQSAGFVHISEQDSSFRTLSFSSCLPTPGVPQYLWPMAITLLALPSRGLAYGERAPDSPILWTNLGPLAFERPHSRTWILVQFHASANPTLILFLTLVPFSQRLSMK
ncbi:hypothetical protein HAX54_014375, partial [Datura stramonium]|nr:hypothetical protein [Datura stramonium]